MKKHEELNLKFYKKNGPFNVIMDIVDSSNAPTNHKRLDFIGLLPKIIIADLIETITLIQNNESYDPSFLDSAEHFSVFDVTFSNPYFSIENSLTIHMNDLKLLLIEWLEFRNS